MPIRRFAILDRDGTILVERHYLKSVDEIELLPRAVEGLRLLAEQGFGLVVITNQSGIGRGLMTVDEVEAIHLELQRRLRANGVELAAMYYCPHAPSDNCECRKPGTALAAMAAVDLGFDPSQAVVIGDKATDIEFGRKLNARTILVRTGYGRQHEPNTLADIVADDLEQAAHALSRDYR